MNQWDNILIIASNNSDIKGTTLACSLIQDLSTKHKVTAIKIIPNFNSACKLCISVINEDDYIITEEKLVDTGKDSSRMLAAGAHKVLFIQAKGNGLQKCFDKLSTFLPKYSPIIIESADLHEFVRPGCLILLSGDKPIEKSNHLIDIADIHLHSQDKPDIRFKNSKWEF